MEESSRSRYRVGAWVALIFVTSCFYIPGPVFIRFVQAAIHHEGFRRWFAQFWVARSFYVVKGWHATEYAVLLNLVRPVMQRWMRGGYRASIAAAFAFAVLFAISDEWHQTFVPGRDGCARDVLIDCCGAALAALTLAARSGAKVGRVEAGVAR